MHYLVTHTTEYLYHHPVSLCHNIARIIMRDTEAQHCKKPEITISPKPDVVQEYQDFYGNNLLYFAIQQEHKSLSVTVETMVEKRQDSSLMVNLYGNTSWEQAKTLLMQPGVENFEARQYIPFTEITLATPEIVEYTLESFPPGRSIFDASQNLMNRIYNDFEFKSGFTTVATPLREVIKARKGVCQDFAHLAVACIRSVGLPARYISGYLETIPPEGKEKLVGVDASHAWFSVYIPQSGWIEFDPTNNVIPGNQHLTIGWGRDYDDVSPLKGVILSSGPHRLRVAVDVKRLH